MHINASAIEKVILFGDSLMAGYGLPKEQHLSLVLESNLVRSGLNIKVINGSVSGSTSSGGLNRAEWSLSEPGIDLIIAGMVAPITHGTKYKKNFDAIYPKLSKKYNLPLIPFLLEGVALDPNLNQQDGRHPNKAGTIVISNTIQDIISKNY